MCGHEHTFTTTTLKHTCQRRMHKHMHNHTHTMEDYSCKDQAISVSLGSFFFLMERSDQTEETKWTAVWLPYLFFFRSLPSAFFRLTYVLHLTINLEHHINICSSVTLLLIQRLATLFNGLVTRAHTEKGSAFL